MEEQKQPVGIEAQCWGCGKVYNITLLKENAKNVLCPLCGGIVVSETGQARIRYVYNEWEMLSPILEEDDWKEAVTGDKPKIILDE